MCIHGDTLIRMNDGTNKRMSELKKDDIVFHGFRVLCILRTRTWNRNHDIMKIDSSTWVTPSHPIKFQTRTRWEFPSSLPFLLKSIPCECLYNVILEGEGTALYNHTSEVAMISLGHNIIGDPVAEHKYLGTNAIISDLEINFSGDWKKGIIDLAKDYFIRDNTKNICRIEAFMLF